MADTKTTESMVKNLREWCIERHAELINSDRIYDAIALDSEFYEWLSISEDDEEETMEILSISCSDE